MADNKKQQLTVWGRANSVNVQKVLWCLAELDLVYERIDAGMQFGNNNEASYLAMNPNSLVPTLENATVSGALPNDGVAVP